MQVKRLRLTRLAHGHMAGASGGAGREEGYGDRTPTGEALIVNVCVHARAHTNTHTNA